MNPDGIDSVSYPGPDPSIRIEALASDKIVARRYRNRRIGEFLKELDLTEGRCTGIPIIRAPPPNGSPPPKFSTDERRRTFWWNCRYIRRNAGFRPSSGPSSGP